MVGGGRPRTEVRLCRCLASPFVAKDDGQIHGEPDLLSIAVGGLLEAELCPVHVRRKLEAAARRAQSSFPKSRTEGVLHEVGVHVLRRRSVDLASRWRSSSVLPSREATNRLFVLGSQRSHAASMPCN